MRWLVAVRRLGSEFAELMEKAERVFMWADPSLICCVERVFMWADMSPFCCVECVFMWADPSPFRSVKSAECTKAARPRLGGGSACELSERLVVRLSTERRAVQLAQSKE